VEPQKSLDQPTRVFVSYAHADERYLRELRAHLTALSKIADVSFWDDRKIESGVDWEHEISLELERSDIFVLMISADYLASAYSELEMNKALKAAREKGKPVLPVILRASAWRHTPIAEFQVLPRGGRPVAEYRNRDEAWVEVGESLRRFVADLKAPKVPIASLETHAKKVPLFEVFKPSGTPTVTFVEPPDFLKLRLSLAQPGRGLVVEGPSGIGKTTALKRAQEVLSHAAVASMASCEILSARRPDHVAKLHSLPSWHVGTVLVDDFHRLPEALRESLADYLKYLADSEEPDKKLIIAGIPRIGERIVQVSYDLATRLDVFRLGRADDALVLQMIQKGERALNVRFAHPNEIVGIAQGSLNVAQLLCFHLCALAGVEETQTRTKLISAPLSDAVAQVMELLEPKFGTTARVFASLGGRHDLTTIEMLNELSRSNDGFMSLSQLRSDRPDLSDGINRFIKQRQIDRVYETVPVSRTFLLFEDHSSALIIDDPQLAFFLAQSPVSKWMRVAGKSAAPNRDQVFVSYSHQDGEWLKRLRVHLKPLERANTIKLWDDTKIRTGGKWREDIATAIDGAKVAVLLVSANFLASDFIIEHELPPLLAAAKEDGAVIYPILVSPSRFEDTPSLSQFQSVNPPNRPLSALGFNDQEEVLLRVSKEIELALSDNPWPNARFAAKHPR
jgi:TIR domain